jgi:pilus assembly protein CpaB
MNAKRILTALTLALFVSGMCTWLVSRRMAAAASQKQPETRYAAPSRELQAGEVLKQEDIELVAWPNGVPISGAYTRIADVLGREALFPLAKGQPVLDRDLSAPGSGTGLASKIPDGMRAVALRSNEVVGVAGFLVPGSHLDVLVTYNSSNPVQPLTATVLQNAVVIAVGHQIEPDPQGKPSDVTIVTLLLTPEESQRAVLANSQGIVHFILRNGGDAGQTANPPILLSQLAADPTPAPHVITRPVAPSPSSAPKRREPEIETVLGGGSSDGPQTGGRAQ